jgi:hypothetical protein
MKRYILEWLALLKEIPHPEQNKFTSRMSRINIVLVICLIVSTSAGAQDARSRPLAGVETQKCAALTN